MVWDSTKGDTSSIVISGGTVAGLRCSSALFADRIFFMPSLTTVIETVSAFEFFAFSAMD
jgi:hypothetical protein|tara:strand:+ start:2466 stop:2645 length:180 start_codon:yes stop_codon:yes gene_type:complete